MFTLDSTTLFYFDLSHKAYSSKNANTQDETVDEWAQGVPQHSSRPNPESTHSSSGLPSLIASRSARTGASASISGPSITHSNDEVRVYDNGGQSDREERTGAEATRARNSPKKNGTRVTQEVCLVLLAVIFS
jgi:hypothetical protein